MTVRSLQRGCVKVNMHEVSRFIACLLLMLPVLMSTVLNRFGAGSLRIIIYAVAFVLAFYADGLSLKKWQLSVSIPWGIIFLISILNRNGDLQQGAYGDTIDFFFIVLFCMLFVTRNERYIAEFLKAMIVLLTFQLVIGFYFWLNPDTYLSFGISFFHLENGTYAYKTFVNNITQKNAFMCFATHYSTSGMYMALAVVLFATYVFEHKQRTGVWSVPKILVFVLFFVALILTQKRGHLLFGAAAILMMYLIGYMRGNTVRRLGQILALVVILVIAFLILSQMEAFQSVLARFTEADDVDELSSGRVEDIWVPAMDEFANHPFFGIGWGQFKYQHVMSMDRHNDCHNIYIQFLCENGIFIALFIVGTLIYTYVQTWRLLRVHKEHPEDRSHLYLLFSFGYQTFFLLYGITGNPFYDAPCFFPYIISCFITYRYLHVGVVLGKVFSIPKVRWKRQIEEGSEIVDGQS